MLKKFFAKFRSSAAVWGAFLTVYLLTFLLVLVTATIITFILPESYSSKARIKIDDRHLTTAVGNYNPYQIQTEFAVIQSAVVLDKVIGQLGLNERWAKKYGAPTNFKTSETRMALRHMLELKPYRSTLLVDITVYDEDKNEAALIANAIAENYRAYTAEMSSKRGAGKGLGVEIISRALPGLKPARPNKPLNIFIGAAVGGVLGLFAGGIAALIVFRIENRSRKTLSLA